MGDWGEIVVCPYCGYQFKEPHEIFPKASDECVEFYCDECESDFTVCRKIEVNYKTYRH